MPATPEQQRRFNSLLSTVRAHGTLAGTAHNRVLIPHDKLTQQDIDDLGFVPVTIAIPESGQNQFRSFRHPDNTVHIHSHDDGWTMHEDRHPAATMIAKKAKGVGETLKAYAQGAPHAGTEGVPGMYYYLKGQLGGHTSTARRVLNELPEQAIRRIDRLKASPTYKAVEGKSIQTLRQLRRQLRTPAAPTESELKPLEKMAYEDVLEAFGVKTAKITTPLQPHQQRLVERMHDPNTRGLVAVHGLGSGKTLSAIAATDALDPDSTDVVTPAALQGNYRKEIEKHTDGAPPMELHSLENTARKGGQNLKGQMLVVDEAHRIRNAGKTRNALMESPATKRLMLTGSLIYNHPADMAGPINLAAGEGTLPASQQDFTHKFIRERQTNPGVFGRMMGKKPTYELEPDPENIPELKKILKKYVDYHPGSTEGFPSRTDEVVKVPMSAKQRELYDGIIGAAPEFVRAKVRAGLPPTKAESGELNMFLSAGRQLSNSSRPFHTEGESYQPKLEASFENLKKQLSSNPRAKAMVYSTYLDAGINPYKKMLDSAKIPYGEFTGEQPSKVRDQIIKDYNDTKKRVLLLSGAGSEGLDLKGTTNIHVLDPHWNKERGSQVIGRGIRFGSHAHLPPEERRVLVQKYLATLPRKGVLEQVHAKAPDMSADEYLHEMSARKERLNSQFRALYETL